MEQLGAPIEMGWLINGSLEEQGLSGNASLGIPISGPHKSSTVYAAARIGNGVGRFYTLAVQANGQAKIIPMERDEGSQQKNSGMPVVPPNNSFR